MTATIQAVKAHVGTMLGALLATLLEPTLPPSKSFEVMRVQMGNMV